MLSVDVRHQLGGFALAASFAAPTPGVIALFGRSGSGKTTLVNIVSGLLRPDAGSVRLDDQVLTDTATGAAVPVEQRCIGYVFQDARLFPHLSVEGNLRYGERRAGGRREIGFDEVVHLLGLEQFLARRPHRLSGGERQRVALGRALLSQPRLLLLDEPLAALDLPRREEVLPYLEALRERLRIPILYVSHQFEEVLRLATHLVLLDAGRVLAHGSVSELALHPALQGIVGADLTGAVIDAAVLKVGADGDAELAVGSGTLQASVPGALAGSRVRLHVLGARCHPRPAATARGVAAQLPRRHGARTGQRCPWGARECGCGWDDRARPHHPCGAARPGAGTRHRRVGAVQGRLDARPRVSPHCRLGIRHLLLADHCQHLVVGHRLGILVGDRGVPAHLAVAGPGAQ